MALPIFQNGATGGTSVPTIAGSIAAAFSSVYSAVTGQGSSVITNSTPQGTVVTTTGAAAPTIGGLSLGTVLIVGLVAWMVFRK